MPKMVDPVERRRELGTAVWRVIRRDGLDRASVRNVAREANLSMGSLRHYFSTQAELLIFAMELVTERVEARVAALELPDDPRQAAERVLRELLPLDAQRRAENEVWLAFTARAQVDSELGEVRDAGYDLLRSACQHWVRPITERASLDLQLETDRLFALMDGLALHAAMRPDQATPDRLAAVLSRHLDTLA